MALSEAEAGGRSGLWRRLVGLAMATILVASLAAWYATREPLPRRIRIATGRVGGLYERFGQLVAPHLAQSLGREVRVLSTAGSVENEALLLARDAELAVLQAGSTPLEEVFVVTPLYRDVVHVVVRRDGDVREIPDLAGRRVALGPSGSGMRHSAGVVLAHYGVRTEALTHSTRYFMDLAIDEELDAAVVTTGLLSPSLSELLGSGRFSLLPVEDADALSLRHAELEAYTVPRGLYRESPPVPSSDLRTVATTSVLAVRRDAPAALVEAALDAVYQHDLRRVLPTLIARTEAIAWESLPRHPAARSYFDPYAGLGLLANFMESLAALKELLFALGAGAYLAWNRHRRREERERAATVLREKERLDAFLEETIRIERQQMATDEPGALRDYLDEVTRIKLRALEELTHEDLRGDVRFAIFLQQCANLIRKIQEKLAVTLRDGGYPAPSGRARNP